MRFSNKLFTTETGSVLTAAIHVFIVAVALYSLEFLRGVTAVSRAAEPKSPDDSPLLPFHQGSNAGYIDLTGKIVIRPKFYSATPFSQQLAAVANAAYKWGYVDRRGQLVIPLRFDDAEPFSEGRAAVKIRNKWTYVDKSGTQITAPQFSRAEPFREGLALVCVGGETDIHGMFAGGKWGFIDSSGGWVIPAQFDSAFSFSEGFAWASNNREDGSIDKWG